MPIINNPPTADGNLATKAEERAEDARRARENIEIELPPMPGATVPSGITVTASSFYGVGYEPEKAFDVDALSQWASVSRRPTVESPEWIEIEYPGDGYFIEGYEMIRNGNDGQSAVSWRVESAEVGGPLIPRDSKQNQPNNGNLITGLWGRTPKRQKRLRLTVTDLGSGGGFPFVGIIRFNGIIHPDSKPIGFGRDKNFTFTQANHGFPPLKVVARSGNSFVFADKNGPIDIFVISKATTNTFDYFLGGRIDIVHPFGDDPVLLYLGDDGNMTTTPPAVGQTPREQLIMGMVLGRNSLFIKPEWRAA